MWRSYSWSYRCYEPKEEILTDRLTHMRFSYRPSSSGGSVAKRLWCTDWQPEASGDATGLADEPLFVSRVAGCAIRRGRSGLAGGVGKAVSEDCDGAPQPLGWSAGGGVRGRCCCMLSCSRFTMSSSLSKYVISTNGVAGYGT